MLIKPLLAVPVRLPMVSVWIPTRGRVAHALRVPLGAPPLEDSFRDLSPYPHRPTGKTIVGAGHDSCLLTNLRWVNQPFGYRSPSAYQWRRITLLIRRRAFDVAHGAPSMAIWRELGSGGSPWGSQLLPVRNALDVGPRGWNARRLSRIGVGPPALRSCRVRWSCYLQERPLWWGRLSSSSPIGTEKKKG